MRQLLQSHSSRTAACARCKPTLAPWSQAPQKSPAANRRIAWTAPRRLWNLIYIRQLMCHPHSKLQLSWTFDQLTSILSTNVAPPSIIHTLPTVAAAVYKGNLSKQENKVSPCPIHTQDPHMHDSQQRRAIFSPKATAGLPCSTMQTGKGWALPAALEVPQHPAPTPCYSNCSPLTRQQVPSLSTTELWRSSLKCTRYDFCCCYYLLQHSLGLQY